MTAKCILPWMKSLKPKSNLCKVENKSFRNAMQEYLCEINSVKEFYDIDAFKQKCAGYNLNHSECFGTRSCEQIIIERFHMSMRKLPQNQSWIEFTWDNPRILYVEDFVSYDFHNFIGEVGGFLGLFLGFSFTSTFGLLKWIRRQIQTRKSKF